VSSLGTSIPGPFTLQGAAPYIQNKDYLLAAAGILGTEAYHGGALRAILLDYGYTTQPYGLNISTVSQMHLKVANAMG